jgi:hypothetical protein
MRFPLRARAETFEGFVLCNHTLIMDVIKALNQFGINSIKFTLNAKIRSEFVFSFEFCWPFVKVFNTKVVPNNPFYLQKNSHIFRRYLVIFPNFYKLLRCLEIVSEIINSVFLNGPDPLT